MTPLNEDYILNLEERIHKLECKNDKMDNGLNCMSLLLKATSERLESFIEYHNKIETKDESKTKYIISELYHKPREQNVANLLEEISRRNTCIIILCICLAALLFSNVFINILKTFGWI